MASEYSSQLLMEIGSVEWLLYLAHSPVKAKTSQAKKNHGKMARMFPHRTAQKDPKPERVLQRTLFATSKFAHDHWLTMQRVQQSCAQHVTTQVLTPWYMKSQAP
eukprot:3383742-Amphidinium_carterae.1